MSGTTPSCFRPILDDPSASHWLKEALQKALERDPVDALTDAIALSMVLRKRLRAIESLATAHPDAA